MTKNTGTETNAEFAEKVIQLFGAAVRGKPCDIDDRDVRRVALGLATLQQLVSREIRTLESTLDWPAYALVDADAILNALTTGRKHPIWRHITGLQAGRRRPQRAGPNAIENLIRAVMVGFVRAYQRTANVSQSEAIRQVMNVCRSQSDGDVFTFEQIRAWDRRFRERGDPWPDGAANTLLQKARGLDRSWSLSEKLLEVGRSDAFRLLAVPTLGKS